MATLADLATKGKRNYARKIERMRKEYRLAEKRAKEGYDATPFGPTRKANYKDAWTAMPDNYDLKVKPGLEEKWAKVWEAKMKE